MNLSYFNETVYEALYENISNNIDFYTKKEFKLDELCPNLQCFETSTYSANLQHLEPKDNLSTAEKNEQDLVNTRIIYESLNFLTPIVATNIHLWSYLCHTIYKEYVISRWIKNPEEEDKKEGLIGTITDRFFNKRGKQGLLRFNAISRLWWAGYLTYDINHGDQYHLTRILFTGQEICADILDTPFCGNKTIITGILLAIEQYKEEIAENINSDLVRKCVKYFRRYAAVTSVDFLTEAEIQDIIFAYLKSN